MRENRSSSKANGAPPQQTASTSKKRKAENPSSSEAHPTPRVVSRPWTPKEEMQLVTMLSDHRAKGRSVPYGSQNSAYWTELLTLLYPGDKSFTERRMYDKVRRMLSRYNECLPLASEGKEPWKNAHEKVLFEHWKKIFVPEVNGGRATPVTGTRATSTVSENVQKLGPMEESSEEDEERDDGGTRANTAVEASDASDEEENDDEDSHEALPERSSNPVRSPPPRSRKDDRRPNRPSPRYGGSSSSLFAPLKEELLDYVRNMQSECMRELNAVKGVLLKPSAVQSDKLRIELAIEELALQEKEFEIKRRFCRLQREAYQLQSASVK